MSNFLPKYTFRLLVGVVMTLALGSCINDSAPDMPDGPSANNGRVEFVLRIGALASEAPKSPSDIQELVKSLRIIIIDKSGFIEVNEKVDLESEEYLADRFSYVFRKEMKANTKKLFLLANEESVGQFQLPEDPDFTADIPTSSLSAMLAYFAEEPEPEDDDAPGLQFRGPLFEKVLNNLYFDNDYESIRSGNKIYLPYSAYYELGIFDMNDTHMTRPFYLVPVATKIDFEVINYRRYGVTFDDIIISSADKSNYLNASLPAESRLMEYNGRQVWWIEWLQACAQESQIADDNVAFNEKWGWIDAYSMPTENRVDYSLNRLKENWYMQPMIDKDNPDHQFFGPCYVPESKNIIEVEDEETGIKSYRQSYTLTFKIIETIEDASGITYKEKTLANYEIDTMKALFRATHIKVFVELFEKAIEIYAEIVPWRLVPFRGYVQQEDD